MDAMTPRSEPSEELRRVDRLRPHPQNPKKHSAEQIEQIATLWREFGQHKRIVIDEDGMILAGHGNWLAARSIGQETIKVVVMHGLTEAEKLVIVLADNKVAENAETDADLVRAAMKLIEEAGLDLRITAFSTMEIDKYLNEVAEQERQQFVEPDPYGDMVDFSFGDFRARCSRDVYERFVARVERDKLRGLASLDDIIARLIK